MPALALRRAAHRTQPAQPRTQLSVPSPLLPTPLHRRTRAPGPGPGAAPNQTRHAQASSSGDPHPRDRTLKRHSCRGVLDGLHPRPPRAGRGEGGGAGGPRRGVGTHPEGVDHPDPVRAADGEEPHGVALVEAGGQKHGGHDHVEQLVLQQGDLLAIHAGKGCWAGQTPCEARGAPRRGAAGGAHPHSRRPRCAEVGSRPCPPR